MRDLTRAREVAVEDLRRKRQLAAGRPLTAPKLSLLGANGIDKDRYRRGRVILETTPPSVASDIWKLIDDTHPVVEKWMTRTRDHLTRTARGTLQAYLAAISRN
jgi:hypothetical protein